jgi:hypothetical protein
MRTVVRCAVGLGLVGVGYVLGSVGVWPSRTAQAQLPQAGGAQEPAGLSKETAEKVKAAIDAVKAATTVLQEDGRYTPAVNGVNAFAATVGGVNALEDLETNRAVDPETFAALYAGQAVDEIAEHLGRDREGRLTYKDKVVRMYSLARIRELLAQRELIGAAAK